MVKDRHPWGVSLNLGFIILLSCLLQPSSCIDTREGQQPLISSRRNVTIPGDTNKEAHFTCGVLDTASNTLFLVTSDNLVLKVDILTMKIMKSISIPDPLKGECSAAVLDASRGLVYVGLAGQDASNVVSFRLIDLFIGGVVELPNGATLSSSGGLIPTLSDYAYFGALLNGAAHIVRISLEQFQYAGAVLLAPRETVIALIFPPDDKGVMSPELSDDKGGDHYRRQIYAVTAGLNRNVLYNLIITPNDFRIQRRNPITTEVGPLTGGNVVIDNDVAFFGTSQKEASKVVKISLRTLEITEKDVNLDSTSYSAVLNHAANRILFGTQKGIVKYDINKKAITGVVPIEGQHKAVALFHQRLGVAYFSNGSTLFELPDAIEDEIIADSRHVHPADRCVRPMGGTNALIPAAVVYTILAVIALCGLFGYSLYPWRGYRTPFYLETPVVLWGCLFIICALHMAAFFVDISRDTPTRYLIVSTIFLNLSYFVYVIALLWAFLSWVQTARRLLLEDPASHAHRSLRTAMKLLAWLPALILLAGLILVVVFRDAHSRNADEKMIIYFGIQSLVMAAFFLGCFLFYALYTFPLFRRLPSEDETLNAAVRSCVNIYWWILFFTLLCIPMGLLSPSTSRVSVTREEDVRCDVPVLVSALHLVADYPRDNLGGLFVDVFAELIDIMCLVLLCLLGWFFFRMAELHRKIAQTDDYLREEARRRQMLHQRERVREEGGEVIAPARTRTVEEEAIATENVIGSTSINADEEETPLRGHPFAYVRPPGAGYERPSDIDNQLGTERTRQKRKRIAWRACMGTVVVLLLIGLVLTFYFVWPRYADWQIQEVQINSIWLNPDFSVELEMTVNISLQNRNYLHMVATDTLVNMTWKEYHIATTQFPDFTVEPRELNIITLHVPLSVTADEGVALLRSAFNHDGRLRFDVVGTSRGVVFQFISAKVLLQCLQTIDLYAIPPQIIQSESYCTYTY